MLMKFELMQYASPVGDNEYEIDVENAPQSVLREVAIFDASYSEIYGHRVIRNIEKVKQAIS